MSDLATLRDIGNPDTSDLAVPSPLALSPDGQRLAFIETAGDPRTNVICRRVLVLTLGTRDPPRQVDHGGEPILATGVYRGSRVTTGVPAVVTPRWSPDGKQLAYLRRDGGVTRLWLADLDGDARPVSPAGVDTVRFQLDPSGRTLWYAVEPASSDAAEALVGFHYDDRFAPNRGPAPQPAATGAIRWFPLDWAGKPSGRASSQAPAGLQLRAVLVHDKRYPLHPPQLWWHGPSGSRSRCEAAACRGGIVAVFARSDADLVLFLKREGWAGDHLALYRWTPRRRSVERLWTTAGILLGCVEAPTRLLCLAETSLLPRRIVTVDPHTGAQHLLYDPNPAFAGLSLPGVRRLFWRNQFGLEARGDLVVPAGAPPAGGWPMIVTQYGSDGFLRGATGDEFPILPFAARGYAVLSVQQPRPVAYDEPDLASAEAINAYDTRDWKERRSLLSSLLIGVESAAKAVPIDAHRIGLTGLSDGATTVAFALLTTRVFAAAAVASCCIEPWSAMVAGGPAYAAYMRRLGYPPTIAGDERFWAPLSLAQGAAAVTTPLLMQLADDEYLLALQTYTALKEAGTPVDLYVFPDEHHIKWQPAHRLASYARSLDWFDFWLRDREDADPAKADQYRWWRALRSGGGSPGLPRR